MDSTQDPAYKKEVQDLKKESAPGDDLVSMLSKDPDTEFLSPNEDADEDGNSSATHEPPKPTKSAKRKTPATSKGKGNGHKATEDNDAKRVDGFLPSQHTWVRKLRDCLKVGQFQALYYLGAVQVYRGEQNFPPAMKKLMQDYFLQDAAKAKTGKDKTAIWKHGNRMGALSSARSAASELGYTYRETGDNEVEYEALPSSKINMRLEYIIPATHKAGNKKRPQAEDGEPPKKRAKKVPAKKLAKKPAEMPVESSADKPADKPDEKPDEKPVVQPDEKPANPSAENPIEVPDVESEIEEDFNGFDDPPTEEKPSESHDAPPEGGN
ncbi:hypothetical protein FGADI_9973 [Fusarium gaditjirri]|uniref:Uncharacterized protein n=1 Tax=Fusarium gaditjirri TaxID=282569 RepID=A0A8H4SYN1_9HYPO|nr:hypothetical protein FGADI_9973 [Fusarium gaditjirri]